MPRSHYIIPSRCPNCFTPLDGATCFESNRPPTPGDFTVCIYCAHVLVFGHDLTVRRPTGPERTTAKHDPRVRRIVSAARRRIARMN